MKNAKLYCFVLFALAAIALGAAPARATDTESVALDFSLSPGKADMPNQTAMVKVENQPLAIPNRGESAPLGRFDTDKAYGELPPPPPAQEIEVAQQPAIANPSPTPTPDPVLTPDSTLDPTPEAPLSAAAIAPEPDPSVRTAPDPAPEAPLSAAVAPEPNSSTGTVDLEFEPFELDSISHLPLFQDNPNSPDSSSQSNSSNNSNNSGSPDSSNGSNNSNSSNNESIAPNPSADSTYQAAAPKLDALFSGGPNSLVARAIGAAEGTRTPEGGRTRAYGGHTDPGNGHWNLGTFSYQHGANSPEEADEKQLQRLQGQGQTLMQQATQAGIQLNTEEKLNGLDLANQSPRAALNTGGYVDRLKQAREMGLTGSEAVLWARTRSFLDPDTNKWNAPGLGNTVQSITADQERRLEAIARAMDAQPGVDDQPTPIANVPAALSSGSAPDPEEDDSRSIEAENADQIVQFDLPSEHSVTNGRSLQPAAG